MIYIAYFIFGFTILQFLVALANIIFYPGLPKGKIDSEPLVSVLIPARNEENNIGTILNDLKNQHYQNIEIIVFNDLSTDKTEEMINASAKLDNRIKLINSNRLPEGWLGKVFGCYSLAQIAKGDYFLFLDADVRVSGDIISNSVSFMNKKKLGLISIFPKQILKSFGEKITVPNMNYILLTLLPLIFVRKSKFQSFAAANGQFMFFDAKLYKEKQPHEKMKNNKVEDIAIARYYKQNKIKISCLVGNKTMECRMYNCFSEATNGFSKNVTAFFGNSFIVSVIFWLLTTFGFLFILLNLPITLFIIFIFVFFATRIFVSIVSKQNIFENLILIVPQQLSLGIFIYKGFINRFIKDYQWKGRSLQ
jgi:cellulose synthase/poly-beta-1,6-N-acetylglucosamine synthase-like glycosyltransferase